MQLVESVLAGDRRPGLGEDLLQIWTDMEQSQIYQPWQTDHHGGHLGEMDRRRRTRSDSGQLMSSFRHCRDGEAPTAAADLVSQPFSTTRRLLSETSRREALPNNLVMIY